MSILPRSVTNPNTSVLLGVADGAIVTSIYQHVLPNAASIRTATPHDRDIEGARKMAAWSSAAVLGFMFLLTRDRNAFLIGGLVLASVDFMVKHSNGFNPDTGSLDSSDAESIAPELTNMYPLPGYEEAAS